MCKWYWIHHKYQDKNGNILDATFSISACKGIIFDAAPIAKWTIAEPITSVLYYFINKRQAEVLENEGTCADNSFFITLELRQALRDNKKKRDVPLVIFDDTGRPMWLKDKSLNPKTLEYLYDNKLEAIWRQRIKQVRRSTEDNEPA